MEPATNSGTGDAKTIFRHFFALAEKNIIVCFEHFIKRRKNRKACSKSKKI